MTAPQWMMALGIPDKCITRKSSAEEKARKFSIRPRPGEVIWRIKVDDGWFSNADGKKVDYLFWGQTARGQKLVLLVELKGGDFSKALQQIASTLGKLCKNADGQGIHTGNHRHSPGHETVSSGGVRAYVVLSKGRGVPQRQRERELLRQRYGVIVTPGERQIEFDGLSAVLQG